MNILFICNGNVARSQEAELFFNAATQSAGLRAFSAGTDVEPGKPIDPSVVEVMDELGHDISQAQRKSVNDEMIQNADIVISFKPESHLPEYIKHHGNIRYWDIDDPRHKPIEFHRQVSDDVKNRVEALIKELHV